MDADTSAPSTGIADDTKFKNFILKLNDEIVEDRLENWKYAVAMPAKFSGESHDFASCVRHLQQKQDINFPNKLTLLIDSLEAVNLQIYATELKNEIIPITGPFEGVKASSHPGTRLAGENTGNTAKKQRQSEGHNELSEDGDTAEEVTYCPYKMSSNPRGICLILSYDKFDKSPPREGNENDIDRLTQLFEERNFKILEKKNLTFDVTKNTITEISEKDHSSYDCFVCIVCSHGNLDSFMTSDEKDYKVKDLLDPFKGKNCKSLAWKPKVFMINSCRGKASESLQQDGGEEGVSTGIENFTSDERHFLVVLSTVPGYVSFRDKADGTLFIDSVFHSMEKFQKEDIVSILTYANWYLLKKFLEKKGQDKCQTLLIISSLHAKLNLFKL